MTSLPPAIIFINADMNSTEISRLQTQLKLAEVVTDTEFDARVLADPNYPQNVHLQNLRILVIRQDLSNLTNRQYADVVLFVKLGLASVLKNNYGPPGATYPIQNINIYDLLRSVESPYVVVLPQPVQPPQFPCNCVDPKYGYGIGGIVAEELRDQSGINCPNPDNERNNPDFINRK